MDTLTAWALNNLAAYGAPALLFTAFIGSLGIPFPITLVIVAAGALVRAGALDARLAFLACVLGAAVADHSEYLVGRLAQPWLKQRFGRQAAWQQAQTTINRQGAWAILLTRFWLMPLAPAVNVLAGSRYPFAAFLALDLLGQLIWVLLYGGLGYLFATQWEWLSQAAGVFSALSLVLFGLGVAGYILVQRRKTRSAV